MAELWGAIQRALGWALGGIFEAIPSYGVAIILLTVAVRLILIPLTVKQIRSMTAMTRIQPQLKELQKKHKGDREKLNQEMMRLYKEHGVNPFGGCLPLIAQMPVFIALFTVLRAFITVDVAVATTPEGGPIPAVYSAEEVGNVVCRPIQHLQVAGSPGLEIECLDEEDQTRRFHVGGFAVPGTEEEIQNLPDLVSICIPRLAAAPADATTSPGESPAPSPSPGAGEDEQQTLAFACRSALGTGHLPRDSQLFQDINVDRAGFLGMRLGCSATQVGSKLSARQCTAEEGAGGDVADQLPYYLLIALIVLTSFYQAKQMAKRATGQAAQQQKIMTRIMPVMFGFISLSLPAGTNVYFLTTNIWTIGQQAVVLKSQEEGKGPSAPKGVRGPKPGDGDGSRPTPTPEQLSKGQTPKKGKPTPKRKRR